MKNPSSLLTPDYIKCMAAMRITRSVDVAAVANKLIRFVDQGRYTEASAATGVPQIWIAASFEREASSDFSRSPAQGDHFDRVSVNVPKGRGPFPNWAAAAKDAYHLNGLDKVGAANWTWSLACYYGELFNGFGYRDTHNMRTPYLWGGTNMQQMGKYTTDHGFDAGKMDAQLGIVPIMMRLVMLRPSLILPGSWPFALGPQTTAPSIVPPQTPLAAYDIAAIQRALKLRGFDPGLIDGSFGRHTSQALRAFEESVGYTADGLLDPQTASALLVEKPPAT